jgi:hypothetical protein
MTSQASPIHSGECSRSMACRILQQFDRGLLPRRRGGGTGHPDAFRRTTDTVLTATGSWNEGPDRRPAINRLRARRHCTVGLVHPDEDQQSFTGRVIARRLREPVFRRRDFLVGEERRRDLPDVLWPRPDDAEMTRTRTGTARTFTASACSSTLRRSRPTTATATRSRGPVPAAVFSPRRTRGA